MKHGIERARRSAIAVGAALCLIGGLAQAQAWPAKPVSLIVPFPPGGTTDVLARSLAERLSPVLGQPRMFATVPNTALTRFMPSPIPMNWPSCRVSPVSDSMHA